MAIDHARLSASELGPRLVGLVGDAAPANMQAMVARGLAPLQPRDLLLALYQLWVGAGPESETAAKTASELPDPVLQGALAAADLPATVLDFIARRAHGRALILELLVRHARVQDDTLVAVARACAAEVCDILADNQRRWLNCPAIISALYGNRNCRQSQVRRMLELADNQGVDVDLPVIDEVRAAMRLEALAQADTDEDPAQRDALVDACIGQTEQQVDHVQMQQAVGDGVEPSTESEPAKDTSLRGLKPSEKIRIALLGNKSDRAVLVRDTNKSVAMATIKSPRLRDSEAIGFAADRSLSLDVIRYIASRRDWVKLYAVKLNLVMNPKTPMEKSMALLGHLNRKDVQKVARSRNIPSALAKAAKRRDQGTT